MAIACFIIIGFVSGRLGVIHNKASEQGGV